ncbi:MAG TPA: hypothetical protein VGC41_09990 [Kofleriaceae bacterium]
MPRFLLVTVFLPACLLQSGSPDTEPSAKATKVAAGNGQNYALTTDGAVRVWGYAGHSGIVQDDRIEAPKTIPGLEHGVVDIASYTDSVCALMADSTVSCWGTNPDGQLGTGDTDDVDVPTPIGLSGVKEIGMGGTFACALVGDGVQCWGANDSHQLGIGTGPDESDPPSHSFTPVTVAGLEHGVAHISVGYAHACAVMVAGPMVCWGSNTSGELGIAEPDDTTIFEQPGAAGDPLAPTEGIATPRSIGLGYHWSIVADASGQVKVFGNDYDEQTLGLGPDAFGDYRSPTNILKVPATVTYVSDLCAIASGDVWCWSTPRTAASGDPATPAIVDGVSNIVQVEGDATTCAVDTNGAVFCWGEGPNFELGDGIERAGSVTEPVPVLSFP